MSSVSRSQSEFVTSSSARSKTRFLVPTRSETSAFIGEVARIKTRAAVLILVAFAALGLAALPVSPSRGFTVVVVVSLATMLASLGVFVWLSQRPPGTGFVDRWGRDIAMLVCLSQASPTIYLLGAGGSVSGILGLLLLLYGLDTTWKWRVAAALVVGVPHVGLDVLMALGIVRDLSVVDPPLSFFVSNTVSNSGLYILSVVLAGVYRRRTGEHLAELAAAGREVAVRDALLREARLDLERVANAGERGRFTEQTLGSFVLGPILGHGGMGEVYEGVHVQTGERAAVKLLRTPAPDATSGELAAPLRRFQIEAAIVGKVDSPNVVRLLEVGGMEAALPFMAMERLDGEGGAALLDRKGRLDPSEVVTLVEHVSAGLLAANEHSVVHRDIKPSNLFLTTDGTWKILDFGLGRIAGDAGTLTRGGLVGTLGYLAPEQLHGNAVVTHRTDIHALAIVAYRALTGRHVFVERDPARVIDDVEKYLPPRPSAIAAVPSAVDAVLRIALAKEPRDRFDDAGAFASAFARAARGEIVPALLERAEGLSRRLDWSSSQRSPTDSRRLKRGRRREPTATLSAAPPPDAAPKNAVSPPAASSEPRSVTVSASATGSQSLGQGSATSIVTLVAPHAELAQSIWLAPARSVALAFVGSTVLSLSMVPFSPWKEMRPFGFVAVLTLMAELVLIRRMSADSSEAGVRRFRTACVAAFFTATALLYFFSPFGDVTAYITLGLLLFGSGVSLGWAVTAALAVAIPHTIMQLGSTFGLIVDRGFYAVRPEVYPRLVNLVQSLLLYGLGTLLAAVFHRHSGRTLAALSEAFRKNTEREALLQDARLALERALGVGQPGRFSLQRMGSFMLGDVLGRGGMGEVYEASHVITNERAAVKLLTRRSSSGEEALAAFERETKAVAALSSPHIVRVLEIGAEERLPYLAMERLVGSDLSALLQRRLFLPPAEVADMVEQVAAGLECARANGIVHGDITPKNLFLTDDGVWKVLDFGSVVRDGVRLATAMHAGTPGYMAPEQLAEASALDHRVDVHALAVVAYRALTGRPAFGGADAATTLYRVLHEMPPRPSAVSSVPATLDDVLCVGLAKTAADRFGDAASFAIALRAATRGARDDAIARRASLLQRGLPWSIAGGSPRRRGE